MTPSRSILGFCVGRFRVNINPVTLARPPVVVICEAGVRSSSAASILQAEGFDGVSHVPEGTGGYRRAGLNLEFSEDNSNYEQIT